MAVSCATFVESATADTLDWIEGHWQLEDDGQIVEEIWTNGHGGLFLAVNRSINEGKASAFEYLRIDTRGEGVNYCAQPGGTEAVCFPAVDVGTTYVVFENPDHDFPQRIRYERSDDSLTATISDLAGEQTFSFNFQRK